MFHDPNGVLGGLLPASQQQQFAVILENGLLAAPVVTSQDDVDDCWHMRKFVVDLQCLRCHRFCHLAARAPTNTLQLFCNMVGFTPLVRASQLVSLAPDNENFVPP